MLIKDKVIEIFCMRDDFCKFFDAMTAKDTLKPIGKRKYHRSATILKTEVMLIMNLFYNLGYRCFKHFYLEKVCKHLGHLFPNVVSYNRLVELEKGCSRTLNLVYQESSIGKMFYRVVLRF